MFLHLCLYFCIDLGSNFEKLSAYIFGSLQSWGGKENGFGLAECCKNLPPTVSIRTEVD